MNIYKTVVFFMDNKKTYLEKFSCCGIIFVFDLEAYKRDRIKRLRSLWSRVSSQKWDTMYDFVFSKHILK